MKALWFSAHRLVGSGLAHGLRLLAAVCLAGVVAACEADRLEIAGVFAEDSGPADAGSATDVAEVEIGPGDGDGTVDQVDDSPHDAGDPTDAPNDSQTAGGDSVDTPLASATDAADAADEPFDSQTDAADPIDAPLDSPTDAGDSVDVSPDSSTDAADPIDASLDSPTDAGNSVDASPDSPTDAADPVDAPLDSPTDAVDPVDTPSDSQTDAAGPVDAVPDSAIDVANPNICPYGLSPTFFCLKWGVCQSGVALKCIGNSPVCDYSAVAGFEEVEASCDGLDNDCNGLTDDDLKPPALPLPKMPGVCSSLAVVCQGPAGWGAQVPAGLPAYQTQEAACDGLDNDCDGQTDEMAPAPAKLQGGVCAGAIQACLGAQGWQEPDYAQILNFTADTDSSCDGLDNDCDGETDEDAVCPLWQLGGRGSGKVALSPDGSQLAWLSLAGVHAADPASGKRYYDHFGHRWEVAAAAYSPDGAQLASVGRNDVLRVYPAAYGVGPPGAWPVTAAVVQSGARWTALAFALDGSAVVGGDEAGTLWPVPLATGMPQKPWLAHAKAVTALAFVTLVQGQLQVVVSAAADGTVVARPWPGGVPWPLANLGAAVTALDADSFGRVLVVAPGQPARIVDVATGKTAAILTGSAAAVAGRFAPGGAHAWTVRGDGQLQRWQVPAPGPLVNPPKGLQAVQQVNGPALLPGDEVVDLAVGATRLVLGAPHSGPKVLHLPNLAWSAPQGTGNVPVAKLIVHPAGLLVGAGDDGKLRVWDAPKAWTLQEISAHDGAVLALTRGPGWLLTGGSDFALRLWQWPADGTAVTTVPLNSKTFGLSGPWAQDLAAATDGLSAWAAAGAGVQRVGATGTTAGQKLQAYSVGLGAQVQRVLPSPDGKTLLIALDGQGPANGDHYRLLDATTLQTLWSRSDLPADPHSASWHPSGQWLALSGTGSVHRVSAETGLTAEVLPGWLGQASDLAWNLQGTRLLGASTDGSARVWATAATAPAKVLAVWTRHCPLPCKAVSLRSAAWLGDPAGAVATTGDDGSLMVWRAP